MVCFQERLAFKSNVHLLTEGDAVSLHGGPVGWDALPWTVTTTPKLFSEAEKSQINALPEGSAAIFHLRSPAGDQGFPGTVDAEVLVALVPGTGETLGSAVIVYRAKLEEPNTVTPVNLTQVRLLIPSGAYLISCIITSTGGSTSTRAYKKVPLPSRTINLPSRSIIFILITLLHSRQYVHSGGSHCGVAVQQPPNS